MKRSATDRAPGAVADYSQALVHEGVVWCAGQIGFMLTMGSEGDTHWELAPTLESQARYALENLRAVLQAAGTDFDRALKVQVFLTDMEQYGTFNDIYAGFLETVWRDTLGDEAFEAGTEEGSGGLRDIEGVTFPARAAVAVSGLPKGALIEIDCVAAL